MGELCEGNDFEGNDPYKGNEGKDLYEGNDPYEGDHPYEGAFNAGPPLVQLHSFY